MQSDEECLEWLYDLSSESDNAAPSWLPHPSEFEFPAPEDWKKFRDEAGVSRADVADEVGISRGTVWRWERGDTSPRLCDARDMLDFYREEIEGRSE